MRMLIVTAALAAAGSAAVAASADYYLKIDGVAQAAPGEPLLLKVASAGDLDGDGLPDDGILELTCAGSSIQAAAMRFHVKSPRDAASGQASGKRQHQPLMLSKEWGKATPKLAGMKVGYDVKKVEGTGARAGYDVKKVEGTGARKGYDYYKALAVSGLTGADGLCPAAIDAVKATKSRSNIQNN